MAYNTTEPAFIRLGISTAFYLYNIGYYRFCANVCTQTLSSFFFIYFFNIYQKNILFLVSSII